MKKGILLSFLAVLLIGIVGFALWYIDEQGKMRAGNKDSFIPYNSAIVLSVNKAGQLTPELEQSFAADLKKFRETLLGRVTDTLQKQEYVMTYPYVVAARVEGKSDVALLYVMDHRDVLSRSEIGRFLNQAFAAGGEQVRKYDRYKIYTLHQGKEEVYFAICGGIVLISDSDLYIEDGLKQFDREENGQGENKPHYQNLNKYFSSDAGINVFLNTAAFSELLPLYVRLNQLFPHLDVTHFFKWGALDGEFSKSGICFNGFMQYGGTEGSYVSTLEKQNARESHIEGVVPSGALALGLFNLSDPTAYFSALEAYRYTTGQKESIYNRKQQFQKMFGKGVEEEIRNLLQGEFALVDLAYHPSGQEKDGLIIASLKSGSLCSLLVEKMFRNYAWFDKNEAGNYVRTYSMDKEKAFTYYQFPVEDWARVYWGPVFEGIKNRYLLVEDNYLILASSEKVLKSFIQDYVHGSFIRDMDWYMQLKTKLSAKYNLSWFVRTADVLPYYQRDLTGRWQAYVKANLEKLSLFSSFALQWSNEGNMLYNTLFLNTSAIQDDLRPHVLWQTKLEAPVSMKPVSVINHGTNERELLVQDDRHTLYLINDVGRILWKLPLDAPINSEVYQVDLFKNGKLQYLFSTADKMYLIDRNGNAAGRFPVTFKAACEQGITVFDYDGDRNYRIFVPAVDRKVYLYGLDGNLVQGWESPKADKAIVSKVEHFRVGNKDYIVFADQYRLYILDRKGKERVRVASVFDLGEHTDIYLTHKGGQPHLVFAGKQGNLCLVNFAGQSTSVATTGLSENYRMNVADVNGDGKDECVFADQTGLKAYGLSGEKIFEKKLEMQRPAYPYIYRFSAGDVRIGLTDEAAHQMFLLLSDGAVAKGFPIAGDSPFSIVFSGNDGFFLFAGADNGTVLKYKIQR